MNAFDWIIIGILAGALAAAIVFIVKRRKKGGCSCGCEGCIKNCEYRRK